MRKSLNVANRAIAEKDTMMRMYCLLSRRGKGEGFLKIYMSVFQHYKAFPNGRQCMGVETEESDIHDDG